MNKNDMLVKKIKELTNESKRNGVWESLNEEIKDAVKNNAKFMITINQEISVKNLISKKETNVSESEILPFLKNQ